MILPKIDANKAIGIDPSMERRYENIKYMEFQINSGYDYDGACLSRNDRRYKRGSGHRQR
jgi:hypothetical protein